MGVFDKLKNALFEVEYVEVDELPKKEKKEKQKSKTKQVERKKEEKPIAKKIVLPGKKEEKVEHIEEEELRDEDFEIRPKNEHVKENDNSFMYMDDKDFEVEDEPRIVKSFDNYENDKLYSQDFDIIDDRNAMNNDFVQKNDTKVNNYDYSNKIEQTYHKEKQTAKPYGVDDSYKVNMHEYGSYERKEEKIYFRPSPIISPIYGILDKNYKKEDVVSKKDIRITSSYSRTNVDVDDIRNKAFGRRSQKNEGLIDTTEEVLDDNASVVDLSNDNDKPEVKEVTVGDAIEYFQDLGLEYNVDYVDASKDKKKVKSKGNLEEEIEKEMTNSSANNVKPVNKVKDIDSGLDDDNLFDLIDSMYKDDN